MNNLKVGIIGCGRHAKANIYPSLKLIGVPLLSVCAKRIENAQAIARQYGIPKAYDNYLKMIEAEKLNTVIVVLPEAMQAKVVDDCLTAGTNVFVEKPLGLTASEAGHVAATSARTGKHVMVGFMKRYAPAYMEVKRILDEGSKFGDVLSLTGLFVSRSFGTEDFFIKNAAIHYVDLIRFLFGEIEEVVGYSNSQDENTDLTFSFLCKNGRIGNMFFGGVPSWARHIEEITVTGLNGFVKTENMRRVISHHFAKDYKPSVPRWQLLDEEDRLLTSVDTSGSGGWKDLYLNGYVGELQHFFECIGDNKAPSPSAGDNVKTMEFSDRIIRSLKHVRVKS